jgi:hypothetical protein
MLLAIRKHGMSIALVTLRVLHSCRYTRDPAAVAMHTTAMSCAMLPGTNTPRSRRVLIIML